MGSPSEFGRLPEPQRSTKHCHSVQRVQSRPQEVPQVTLFAIQPTKPERVSTTQITLQSQDLHLPEKRQVRPPQPIQLHRQKHPGPGALHRRRNLRPPVQNHQDNQPPSGRNGRTNQPAPTIPVCTDLRWKYTLLCRQL